MILFLLELNLDIVVYQYLIEISNMLSINAYLTSFFCFSGSISLYFHPMQNNFSMLYEFISSMFYFLTVVSLKHILKILITTSSKSQVFESISL